MSTRAPRESWPKTQTRRVARSLARRIREYTEPDPVGLDLPEVTGADLAIHFADGPQKFYQLQPWLAVLSERSDLSVIIVCRGPEAYLPLRQITDLPIALVPRFDQLMRLYDRANFRAVLYVNNSYTNFQSLAFQQAVHIHVNHGESDKICMVSNQAKAYDLVFVAGEAAVQRHRDALAWFDLEHLVRVGRPQLDLDVPSPLSAHLGPTITYAPTWEGEDQANNYTSVDCYGSEIIEASLAQPGARVVYKPHPRVADSDDARIRRAHEAIVQRLEQAQRADPGAGHAICLTEDILGIIRSTDVFIGDVSSVTLDHLYLRPSAPIALTDRRNDRERLLADTPIASGAHIIDATTIADLPSHLAAMLSVDDRRAERDRLRDLYFDGLAPGESTERFWACLHDAIARHDTAVAGLGRLRVAAKEDS